MWALLAQVIPHLVVGLLAQALRDQHVVGCVDQLPAWRGCERERVRRGRGERVRVRGNEGKRVEGVRGLKRSRESGTTAVGELVRG